jgi:hypothetical protein
LRKLIPVIRISKDPNLDEIVWIEAEDGEKTGDEKYESD